MRSVFLTSLIIFILVASGGYGITWYAQASATQSTIEEFIAKINQKQKYITYESIETSGFPSKVQVSVIKPRFQGRLDLFFKEINAQNVTPANAPEAPQWDEDIVLDGKITFGINAMSDHYTMNMSGNWRETSVIGGQTTTSLTHQASDVTCLLHFQRSTGIFDDLWDYGQLNRSSEELIKDFRAFDCNTLGQTTTDAQTKAVLSNSGLTRLYLTSAPMPPNHQARFYLKVTDAEVTALGDARMSNYMRVISPGYPGSSMLSAYGKQNIDIDFTYHGPTDFKTEDHNPPLDITLNKFDVHNQVYNYALAFRFNNTPQAQSRTITTFLKSEASFTEQYDVMLHDVARGAIQQIISSPDPKYKELQDKLRKYNQEQLYAIVYPVIPKLSPLGKIVTAFDASYAGSDNFTAGNFKLNGFEISLAPYSINGKGEVTATPGQLPSGSMYIVCSNCLSIIDDVTDYALRMQKMMSYFDPEKAATMTVDAAQGQAYKKFLRVLAQDGKDEAGKPIMLFNIISNGPVITINGKDMNQVLVLYNEYVRSVSKQPSGQSGAKKPRSN